MVLPLSAKKRRSKSKFGVEVSQTKKTRQNQFQFYPLHVRKMKSLMSFFSEIFFPGCGNETRQPNENPIRTVLVRQRYCLEDKDIEN